MGEAQLPHIADSRSGGFRPFRQVSKRGGNRGRSVVESIRPRTTPCPYQRHPDAGRLDLLALGAAPREHLPRPSHDDDWAVIKQLHEIGTRGAACLADRCALPIGSCPLSIARGLADAVIGTSDSWHAQSPRFGRRSHGPSPARRGAGVLAAPCGACSGWPATVAREEPVDLNLEGHPCAVSADLYGSPSPRRICAGDSARASRSSSAASVSRAQISSSSRGSSRRPADRARGAPPRAAGPGPEPSAVSSGGVGVAPRPGPRGEAGLDVSGNPAGGRAASD